MNVPSMIYPVALAICALAVLLGIGRISTWRFDKGESAPNESLVGAPEPSPMSTAAAALKERNDAAIREAERILSEIRALQDTVSKSVKTMRETESAH